jgi:hypothetical protein
LFIFKPDYRGNLKACAQIQDHITKQKKWMRSILKMMTGTFVRKALSGQWSPGAEIGSSGCYP